MARRPDGSQKTRPKDNSRTDHQEFLFIQSTTLTMTTFPLLDVPLRISYRILHRLDLGELFDLSQCSGRTFDMIKNFRVYKPSTLMVFITPSSTFSFYCRVSGQQTRWVFYHNRDPVIMDLENPRTYNIKNLGLQMDFCVTRELPRPIEYGCVSSLSPQNMLKVVQYLITLFNAPVRYISTIPNHMMFLDDILEIDAIQKSQVVHIHSGKITHGEMETVLKRFDTKKFTLQCTTKENLSINQTVKCDTFHVYDGKWVSLQTLKKLDCAFLSIYETSFTNQDLNKFLKCWLNGSYPNLEYITFAGSRSDRKLKLNLSRIVKGIPNTPGVPKRADATKFNRYAVSYENGVDLKRADGMRATAVVSLDDFRKKTFLFVVWHVSNPDLVVVE